MSSNSDESDVPFEEEISENEASEDSEKAEEENSTAEVPENAENEPIVTWKDLVSINYITVNDPI